MGGLAATHTLPALNVPLGLPPTTRLHTATSNIAWSRLAPRPNKMHFTVRLRIILPKITIDESCQALPAVG